LSVAPSLAAPPGWVAESAQAEASAEALLHTERQPEAAPGLVVVHRAQAAAAQPDRLVGPARSKADRQWDQFAASHGNR